MQREHNVSSPAFVKNRERKAADRLENPDGLRDNNIKL
jgi:hypothetical protein